MRFLLACITLGLAGCVGFRSTSADKAASLAKYAGAGTGQVRLTLADGRSAVLTPAQSLALVTGWVIAGEQVAAGGFNEIVELVSADRKEEAIALEASLLAGGREVRGGGAVAVTPDGYFLTAAHAVAFPECFVASLHGASRGPLRFVPARVVFADPESDLALIKAATPTPHHLPVRDLGEVEMGTVVFAGRLGKEPAAGELLSSETRSLVHDGRRETYQRVTFLMPVMPGDSGGPLIDEHGQLRGIVSEELFGRFWKRPHRGRAVLPDGDFIARLIARDRASPEGP